MKKSFGMKKSTDEIFHKYVCYLFFLLATNLAYWFNLYGFKKEPELIDGLISNHNMQDKSSHA